MAPAREKSAKGARKPPGRRQSQHTPNLLEPRTKHQHTYRKFSRGRVAKSSAPITAVAKEPISALILRLSCLSCNVPTGSSYRTTPSSITAGWNPTRASHKIVSLAHRCARAAIRFTIANNELDTNVLRVQKCALLELPAEILNRILELCVTKSDEVRATMSLAYPTKSLGSLVYHWPVETFEGFRPSTSSDIGPPPVTSTCKAIRRLAIPMYGSFNTFFFDEVTYRRYHGFIQEAFHSTARRGYTTMRRDLRDLTQFIRNVEMTARSYCSDISRYGPDDTTDVSIFVSAHILDTGALGLRKAIFRGGEPNDPLECIFHETTRVDFPDVESQLIPASSGSKSDCICAMPAPQKTAYDGNTLLAILHRFQMLSDIDSRQTITLDFLKQFKFKECACCLLRRVPDETGIRG